MSIVAESVKIRYLILLSLWKCLFVLMSCARLIPMYNSNHACTSACMFILYVYFACLFCMSILHVYFACLFCMSILHVYHVYFAAFAGIFYQHYT